MGKSTTSRPTRVLEHNKVRWRGVKNYQRTERLVISYIFWNLLLNTLVMVGYGQSRILSFWGKDRELPVPFTDNPSFELFEVDYYMYLSNNTAMVHPK